MNYPALYDFYFPGRKSTLSVMLGALSLGFWMYTLRPIRIQRVR